MSILDVVSILKKVLDVVTKICDFVLDKYGKEVK